MQKSNGKEESFLGALQHLQLILKSASSRFIPEVAWTFHCSVHDTRLDLPRLGVECSQLGCFFFCEDLLHCHLPHCSLGTMIFILFIFFSRMGHADIVKYREGASVKGGDVIATAFPGFLPGCKSPFQPCVNTIPGAACSCQGTGSLLQGWGAPSPFVLGFGAAKKVFFSRIN